MSERTLSNVSPETAADSGVQVVGDPDAWGLICKAWHPEEGWMKSTKAMTIGDMGVLVQVTTETPSGVAEALTFIPGAEVAVVEQVEPGEGDADSVVSARFRRIIERAEV